MYRGTSTDFNSLIEQNGGRTFKPRLRCSSFTIESGIKKITYSAGSSSEEGISVGSAMSAYIEVTTEKIPHVVTGQPISFDLGLEINGAIEYVPMGIFKANKPEMTDYEITFKAYDRMTQAEKNYVSNLTYPTNTVNVMNEIAQKLGIEFVTDISPITLKNPSTEEGSSNTVFAGYTIREAIGYIAGLYGKFAIFNRLGQLEFKWYEDNGFEVPVSKCYSFTKNENDYVVNKIIGTAADDTQYEAGSGITGISFSNPFVTQDIVNGIYTEIGGFTYRGGETKFLGDCRIDVWDIITGEDLFGNTYKLPVMEIAHEIDGGLTTTVKSKVSESESVEDTFKGPVVKAMERTHAQLLIVNNLIASKASIEYLESNYIKTDEIDAIEANIENAVIINLQGKFASFEYLEANYAEIDFANVQKETVGTLLADIGLISSATIVDGHVTGVLGAVKIDASNITLGTLDARVIDVTNLNAANITVGTINGYQIAPGAIDMDNLAESITGEINSASSNAQTALDEALKAFNESQAAALAAGTAQSTADGKNTIFYQSSEPSTTGRKKNDIWYNTAKGNQMYVFDGSKWVPEQFGAGAIADNTITADQIATEVNNRIDNAFTNAGSALAEANAAITAASNALDAFNNLEIGGRNLFPKSKYSTITDISGTISGYGIILQQGSTNVIVMSKQLDTVLFSIGNTYTVQFVAWSDGNTVLSCDIYPDTYGDSMGLPNDTGVAVGTTKQKYVFTGKLENTSGLVTMYLRFWRLAKNPNYKIYISDIMIESGNKASTWTPAPEDLETEINFAQSTADGKNTVYYQTTAPSGTHKVNDVWFDTDDSNKMYYWNGSAWTARQFGTNAIANASITNALIADATIQSAKIANLDAGKITSGYIDAARIKAESITLGQLNTSVQDAINGAAQQIYHSTNAGAGTGGYFHLAQIKISGTYKNQPIKIGVVNRNGVPSTVWITFVGTNNADPGILRFAKTGTANFYLEKAATSTWNLYVGKTEGYDYLSVTEFEKGTYMSSVSVAWQSTMVTALPSGYITATQTIATAEWCYNNDITYINGGKLYTGTVVAAAIAASAITTDKLAANAVTAAKMAVGTITAASGIIANAAIQTANIADLAVTGAKLANATIGTAKIADTAITSAKIADLAVTNAKIADATIQSAKIAALDAAKITTGTLDAARIGANTITANKMAIADFTNYATANENFATANIPTGTFGGTSVSGGYIVKPAATNQYIMFCDYTPCNLKNGEQIYYEMSIKGAVSGSITPKIWYYNANHGNNTGSSGTTNHTISTTETVISGTITVSSTADSAYYFLVGIQDNNSTRKQIYVREVKFIRKSAGNLIVDGAITAGKLSANAVTADKINAGAVTTAKIAAGAVTAATIASSAITADKIAAGAVTAAKLSVGDGGNLYATGYDTFENIPNTAARIYYSKGGSSIVSISTDIAYYGGRCLRIDANGTDAYVYLGDTSNGYGCIPVVAGKTYIVSAWMKSSKTSTAQIYVVGHTTKNASNSQHTAATSTIGTSWTRIYTRYTATSTYPYISVRVDNDTNGTTLWVDAIQIETGTTTQEPSAFSPAGTTVIDGARIVTGSITANSIASSAITADKIAASSITAAKIASAAITADKIAAGAVTAEKISVTDLSALNAKIGGWNIGTAQLYWQNEMKNGIAGTQYKAYINNASNYSTFSENYDAFAIAVRSWNGSSFGEYSYPFHVTYAGKVYMADAEINGGEINLTSGEVQSRINVKFSTRPATYTSISPMYTWLYYNADEYMRLSGYAGGSIVMHRDNEDTVKINAINGVTANSINSTGSVTASSGFKSSNGIYVESTASWIGLMGRGGEVWLQSNQKVQCVNVNNTATISIRAKAFTVDSSLRYKNPLGEMTESEANRLLDLNVVKFDYKKGEKNQYGLYAEETIDKIPQCVEIDEFGRPDSIDYSKLIPFLIKKAQMQEKEIRYLENMVTHLIGIAMNPARVETYKI